jgi:hypothetical protein
LDSLPGHDYIREVPKLNSYQNVVTVGYVRVGWCNRSFEETRRDIELYAGWSDEKHGIDNLHVKGIYLDESPNHVSEHASTYLDSLHDLIRGNEGLLGDRMVFFFFLLSLDFFPFVIFPFGFAHLNPPNFRL